MTSYYVGVDVGSGSVRAAVVDTNGKIVRKEEKKISVRNPRTDFYEQSSEEIWSRCCDVIKLVCSDLPANQIKGLGFCATCSLVVLDQSMQPVSLDARGYDVIMWMDHRAVEEAKKINATDHKVLRFVGGSVSVEMQMPKILWLKTHMDASKWKSCANFFDLADFLTFKATGSFSRSLCCVTCKWNFVSSSGWDDDFLHQIGLSELIADGHRSIGDVILAPGTPVGQGLTSSTAGHTGLLPGTPVSSSLIDAHAGYIGMVGASFSDRISDVISARLGLICGTSSCHMALNKKAIEVVGVWGPYEGVILPGYHLTEGGQSVSGKLIDYVIETHPAYDVIKQQSIASGNHIHDLLNAHLQLIFSQSQVSTLDELSRDLHMWPDFHGNRSPVADETLRGSICGLNLDSSLDNLALMYLTTLQAIALGTRHICDVMESAGHQFEVVLMCGGLVHNPLFMKIHADVLGKPVAVCKEEESVLLGACILAASCSQQETLEDVMKSFTEVDRVIFPDQRLVDFYQRKFRVFLQMLKHQQLYKSLMKF